jgi:hypothetical protein
MELFHNIFMEGGSKYANIRGLTRFLESTTKERLPDLSKLWEYAYFPWLRATEEARMQYSQLVSRYIGSRAPAGSLTHQCIACFFRPEETSAGLYYLIIDGCMSMRREISVSKDQEIYDWGQTFVDTSEIRRRTARDTKAAREQEGRKLVSSQPSKVSIVEGEEGGTGDTDADEDEEQREEGFKAWRAKGNYGCQRQYSADKANRSHKHVKPKTLEGYDETGVIAITCRHGAPLAYSNLYRGENYETVHVTLKHVVSQIPPNARIFVQYDIACKFEPWLAREDPSLAQRCTFALNAFHAYAHDLPCQLRYAPLRIEGLARSDGEGVERCHHKKVSFVKPCRKCSAQHRLWIIDSHNIWYTRTRREHLPTFFKHRHAKIRKEQTMCEDNLQKAFSKWQSKDVEVTLENYRSHLRELDKATKGALYAHRDVADEDGPTSSYPYRDFFQTLCIAQAKGNQKIKVGPKLTWQNWVDLSLTRKLRDKLSFSLAQTGTNQKQWTKGQPLWRRYYADAGVKRLREEREAILHEFKTRVLEWKRVRSRFGGQKEATALLTSITKRSQAIASKIKTYNELCSHFYRASVRDFQEMNIELTDLKIDANIYDLQALKKSNSAPLWAQEDTIRRFYGLEGSLLVQAEQLKNIENLLRIERNEEELHLQQLELGRVVRFVEEELSDLTRFLALEPNSLQKIRACREHVNDTLRLAKGVIDLESDLVIDTTKSRIVGMYSAF